MSTSNIEERGVIDVRELFESLTSIEFEVQAVATTPQALRALLRRTPEVKMLRQAYIQGAVSDEDIRKFVDRLLSVPLGVPRFTFQHALAAIAVALEDLFVPFAFEYVDDLAKVRSARFSLAAGVARESAAARRARTQTVARVFPAICSSLDRFGTPRLVALEPRVPDENENESLVLCA